LREGITKCEEAIKQLEINSTTTQTQINQFFNKIRNKLDEKEQELLNKLVGIEKSKKKDFELQKEELKFGIENIIGSCQMIQNSLSLSNRNGNVRLLSMKKLYQSRLNYLLNNIWRIDPSHPSLEFSVYEKEEESIYSSLSNIGVIILNDISADKCLISRNEGQKIFKDEEYKFEIISYSKEGNEMKEGGNVNNFIVRIKDESKDENIEEDINNNDEENEWKIIDLNNGRYEVKMKFKNERKYSIFVYFNGFNINSSPFQIQVFPKLILRNYAGIYQPKLTFGSKGHENGQFSNLFGIAINSIGNIHVCDFANYRVQIFDSKGRFLSKFGSQGKLNGQLGGPWGITIDSKGNIIVGDYHSHKIQIFNSEEKFISTFGTFGKKNGQFNSPTGICVDKNDNIYVCDYTNHRIQIFNSKGKFLSTFGSKGDGDGQFKNPYGICLDLDDNIFVCDYSNNRIQVFEPNGGYITQFKVNQPVDVIINNETQEVIVCRYDDKVSIF